MKNLKIAWSIFLSSGIIVFSSCKKEIKNSEGRILIRNISHEVDDEKHYIYKKNGKQIIVSCEDLISRINNEPPGSKIVLIASCEEIPLGTGEVGAYPGFLSEFAFVNDFERALSKHQVEFEGVVHEASQRNMIEIK